MKIKTNGVSNGLTLVVLALFAFCSVFPVSAHASHDDDWRSWQEWSSDADEEAEEEVEEQEEEVRTSRTTQSSSLRRKIADLDDDEVEDLTIPILLGVTVSQLEDTWGDARSNGRTHEGIDIFAPRGMYVVSPTDAVVTSIGEGDNGGLYVYTTNPGGERFYFAHLDGYADDLSVGDVLKPGDLIGFVGNTGNASGGATHLHFGIYNRGASNPYPRLTEEFTLKERISAIDRILEDMDSDDAEDEARVLITSYRSLFTQAQAADIDLPEDIVDAIAEQVVAVVATPTARDLTLGSRGTDVSSLQTFLIAEDKGSAAKALAAAGATGYFGTVTQAALAEYQASVGITPAAGYFGAKTRAYIAANGN